MSVFLLKQPEAVFIHVPKTAGRSIRVGAWQGRYEGPVRGHIPTEWMSYFKFGFSRHPIDRLISNWKMFGDGRTDVPAVKSNGLLRLLGLSGKRVALEHHKPLFPGLSIAQFMDIVEEHDIPLDERRHGTITRRKSVLRRHGIPQTHPFNCIHLADYVGRFETIEDSFEIICRKIGASVTLPHTNRTSKSAKGIIPLTADDYDRAMALYSADFLHFNYERETYDAWRTRFTSSD
jgi:hypothetical protein